MEYRTSALDSWQQLVSDPGYLFVDSAVYNWKFELLDFQPFPWGQKNIRIYYQAGFAPIPGDIWKMALEMVAMMWNDSPLGGVPRLGMSSKNKGAVGATASDTFKNMMQTDWKPVIDRWKRYI